MDSSNSTSSTGSLERSRNRERLLRDPSQIAPTTSLPSGQSSHSTSTLTQTRIFPSFRVEPSLDQNKTSPATQPNTICALCENRVNEIGLASYSLHSPVLYISQFSDTKSYMQVLSKIEVHQPKEVLLPKTAIESELAKFLIGQKKFNVAFVARKYWDEEKGGLTIKKLASKESILIDFESKYLCLSSSTALLKYLEYIHNFDFAPKSLKVVISGSENTMGIDLFTAENLELTASLSSNRKCSLFSILNHTKTRVGERFLRTNLLQPPCDLPTIVARQDCLEELLKKGDAIQCITHNLPNFERIDSVLSHLVHIPRGTTKSNLNQSKITAIITLYQALHVIPDITQALKSYDSDLIRAIVHNLEDPRLNEIMEMVKVNLNKDCFIDTKPSARQTTQLLFAVKTGILAQLDVSRKTYSETVQDVEQLVERYNQSYAVPSIKLVHKSNNGFHMNCLASCRLPREAIQIQKRKKSCTFTTNALESLNERCKVSVSEIIYSTAQVLDEICQQLRDRVDAIYKLSESIAILDFMVSLVNYSRQLSVSVRPKMFDSGPLAISQGVHPILEKILTTPYVPSNTFMTATSNFQIIMGPNMSGKTTYIKEVALNVILAHLGSFVPASFFSVRLTDRILSRIGTQDIMEQNASSFFVEMRDTASILKQVTSNSLVIIDELGRSTSTQDGLGIAWGVCERLAFTKAYTLFVTHFHELQRLEDLYPNIKNYHFEVNGEEKSLFSIGLGRLRPSCYGILTAKRTGFPQEVLDTALEFRKSLAQSSGQENSQTKQGESARAAFNIVQRLLSLVHSTLSQEEVTRIIVKMKNQLKEEQK